MPKKYSEIGRGGIKQLRAMAEHAGIDVPASQDNLPGLKSLLCAHFDLHAGEPPLLGGSKRAVDERGLDTSKKAKPTAPMPTAPKPTAPKPSAWAQHATPGGTRYFHNELTGESTWVDPTAQAPPPPKPAGSQPHAAAPRRVELRVVV